jgi:peptidoglycan hydrolase-like protein with peptidoglycan-binding domain
LRRINKALGIALSTVLLVGVLPAKTTQSSGKTKKKTTATASHAKSKTSASKASKTSNSHAHATKTSSKHGRKTAKTKKVRGQQGIQSDRTRQIQAALIREHYLDGEPSGDFDQRTKDAMQRFQRDNGWQTKVIPDSRALIKLGLGPSKDGLLNPESAAIAQPHELGTEREIPGGSVLAPQRK